MFESVFFSDEPIANYISLYSLAITLSLGVAGYNKLKHDRYQSISNDFEEAGNIYKIMAQKLEENIFVGPLSPDNIQSMSRDEVLVKIQQVDGVDDYIKFGNWAEYFETKKEDYENFVNEWEKFTRITNLLLFIFAGLASISMFGTVIAQDLIELRRVDLLIWSVFLHAPVIIGIYRIWRGEIVIDNFRREATKSRGVAAIRRILSEQKHTLVEQEILEAFKEAGKSTSEKRSDPSQ